MSLGRRVERMEAALGRDGGEKEAREVVSFMREIGGIDEHADTEEMVSEFARQGVCMRALLKEIDGQTIGPPGLRGAAAG